MTVVNLCATLTTLELAVVDVGSTDTDGSLEVPMAGEHPLVTVTDTTSDIPALEAMILQFIPEKQVDIGSVVLTTKGMDTDKRTIEPLTEPVAVLRVENPVLGILLVVATAWAVPMSAVKRMVNRTINVCSKFFFTLNKYQCRLITIKLV